MDKELEKTLKNLDKLIKKSEKLKAKADKNLEKAVKEPCKIQITKEKGGACDLIIEGGRLTLLLTLAGAVKSILDQLDCSEAEFNYIKNITGFKEAE